MMTLMGVYAIICFFACTPIVVILTIYIAYKLLVWLIKAIIRGVKYLREYG